MRHRLLRRLALSLGVLVLGYLAPSLRGADSPASTYQPFPLVETAAPPATPANLPTSVPSVKAEKTDATPAASLDRPVALPDNGGIVDNQVQPTLFKNRGDTLAYSPVGSIPAARPLPVGPSDSTALPAPTPLPTAVPQPDVPYTWQQPGTPVLNGQSSSPPVVVPGANGILVPSPVVGTPAGPVGTPGIVGGPIGAPPGDGCCGGDACCTPGCCDGCCWDNCCGGCNGCCFGNRWYASAEYLLWFIRGQPLPPLLTSGSVTDNPPGALGQPGTQVLFGGNSLNNNPYSGARLRLGYWFDDCHKWGLEIGGFFLGGNANRFSTSSLGTPFLARPFFNALTGAQDIEAVATPNGLTGTFTAINTFFLYGAEANLRRNLFCGCNWYIDAFAGWRMLGLNEALTIRENLAVVSSTNPSVPAGTTFIVTDRFATTNLFNGGQIGGIAEYRLGRWSFDLRSSIAVGGTQQNVSINGSTIATSPLAGTTNSVGGLLAQSSNIGHYSRDLVGFVEEVGLNVGYQFTNHIRGFVGYNFLYWNNVVRPGNQIDSAVNPNLIPPSVPGGPARPLFAFHSSDFWAQGVNFGIDIRW